MMNRRKKDSTVREDRHGRGLGVRIANRLTTTVFACAATITLAIVALVNAGQVGAVTRWAGDGEFGAPYQTAVAYPADVGPESATVSLADGVLDVSKLYDKEISRGERLLAFLPPVTTATDVADRVPPAECLVLSKEAAIDEEHECADWKVDSDIDETDTGYAITVTACRLTDERVETITYEGGVDAGGVAKVTKTVTRTICVYGDEGECGEITAADSQTRNLDQ